MGYDQPFWVGLNNPRFPTARNGYLPALEPKEVSLDTDKVEPEWNRRQWGTVQQLKAQVLFLSDKVNQMRAKASKRRLTDTNKLNNIYKGTGSGNENTE